MNPAIIQANFITGRALLLLDDKTGMQWLVDAILGAVQLGVVNQRGTARPCPADFAAHPVLHKAWDRGNKLALWKWDDDAIPPGASPGEQHAAN